MIRWRYFWGAQGFPGSPVLGVVVLFACAQARYSVPEPRVCGRLRLRRLSEGSQVTFCYKGSTYLLTSRSGTSRAYALNAEIADVSSSSERAMGTPCCRYEKA